MCEICDIYMLAKPILQLHKEKCTTFKQDIDINDIIDRADSLLTYC